MVCQRGRAPGRAAAHRIRPRAVDQTQGGVPRRGDLGARRTAGVHDLQPDTANSPTPRGHQWWFRISRNETAHGREDTNSITADGTPVRAAAPTGVPRARRRSSFWPSGRAVVRHPTRPYSGDPPLEEALDLRLFIRTTRAVALSPEGVRLLPHVKTSLASIDRIGLEAEKLGREEAGRLEVGYQIGTGLLLMPAVVREFEAAYPQYSVIFNEYDFAGQPPG